MNAKPRSKGNTAKCEEIRKALGKNQLEFSRMIGFATDEAYHRSLNSSLTGEVADQLVLAAEGLLAREKPNGAGKPAATFLISIASTGEVEMSPVDLSRTMILDGQTYTLLSRDIAGEGR